MDRIRDLLHKINPYANFPLEEYPPDMQGWGSVHPVFKFLIEAIKPPLIIEVGSWKGASAIYMGQLARDAGLSTEILCIDTWLGSPGLYTRKDDKFLASLNLKHGYPSLYYTFLSNVIRAGLQETITPFALPSSLAAMVLATAHKKADLIYIDAAHDYESVKSDLASYWPLLSEEGVLFGDDYIGWPGVTKAVNEFSGTVGLPLYTWKGKFVIPKSPKLRFRSMLLPDTK